MNPISLSTGKRLSVASLSLLLAAPPLLAANFDKDFGLHVEQMLNSRSEQLFGIKKPIVGSAPETTGPYRTQSQKASDQIKLADGLKVEYVTREAGNNLDMMAFYPAKNPTHLIACIEGGAATLSNGKKNPAVQRIDLKTGAVETILRGMDRCDGIRTTDWGTVLATEETDDGSAYEILDPLTTTEVTVTTRGTCGVPAVFSPNTTNIVKRTNLPCMAWEGLIVLPSGVVIGGDELRPGSDGNIDSDGGAIFKFRPTFPRSNQGAINSLNESPVAGGTSHAGFV